MNRTNEKEMKDKRIVVNSVVQVNENGQEKWIGCFVQVSEVKDWGVQGWTQIPMQGSAYIRLKWEQMDYIGMAVLVPRKEEQKWP